MKKTDVIQLMLILFPHLKHFELAGADDNLHFGEYDHKGFRHVDAIYVIRISKPTDMNIIIQLTIFPDGINCWENNILVPLAHQFKAHNFLKQFFPEIV